MTTLGAADDTARLRLVGAEAGEEAEEGGADLGPLGLRVGAGGDEEAGFAAGADEEVGEGVDQRERGARSEQAASCGGPLGILAEAS